MWLAASTAEQEKRFLIFIFKFQPFFFFFPTKLNTKPFETAIFFLRRCPTSAFQSKRFIRTITWKTGFCLMSYTSIVSGQYVCITPFYHNMSQTLRCKPKKSSLTPFFDVRQLPGHSLKICEQHLLICFQHHFIDVLEQSALPVSAFLLNSSRESLFKYAEK